jgi:hypothetical protein
MPAVRAGKGRKIWSTISQQFFMTAEDVTARFLIHTPAPIKVYLLHEPQIAGDSIVGITTGYGSDGLGVGVRVPINVRFMSSPRHQNRFWYPLSLQSNVYRGLFLLE